MTHERKNEIWAMLDADTQNYIKRAYSLKTFNREFDNGYNGALEDIFGARNLTAQAEEKSKEPRFKENDVLYVVNPKHPLYNQRVRLDRWIADGKFWLVIDRSCGLREIKESDLALYTEPKEDVETSDKNGQNPLKVAENGISDSKIQSESAESVETSAISQSTNHIPDTAKKVDYFQYRLDLAKEMAVAMIPVMFQKHPLETIGIYAVGMANEIVKRLKETEE